MTDHRWLRLDGAHNVRDLGGLPMADGRRTRSGVFLRADALDALTVADVEQLAERYGLRHVVDLRSTTERAERGRGGLGDRAGVVYTEVEVIPELDVHRRRTVRAAAVERGDHPDRIMAAGYAELLDLGRPAFRTAFEALADDAGVPALFHCAAGKDRTGVLAALLLANAGVEPEAIVADYALTDERMTLILERLTGVTSFEQLAVEIPVFTFQARAGTMREFLAHLTDERGGATGYLRSIGLADATAATLRELLV